jgi:adenine phosphoribosyltransferase
VDDVLATGGTAKAAIDLIKLCDAEVVGLSFILALDFLGGHNLLGEHAIHSLKTISA